MKVVVTGGSGFLGGFVVPRLVAGGHEVVCLIRDRQRREPMHALGATTVDADLDDREATRRAFVAAGADALVNLASLGFGHAPTIVDGAERGRIGHAVYVSTTAVTTTLATPSKQVRLDAEATVLGAPTPATVVRPTMIYGAPGDRNLERLLRALGRWRIFPLPGGRHLQQPVHVDDLAATIVRAVERPGSAGRTYDVAGPDALPFREIVHTAARAVGRRVWTMPVPARPLAGAAAFLERTGRRGPVSAEQLTRLLEDKAFDNTAARLALGHDPRSFAAGITLEAELLGLRR